MTRSVRVGRRERLSELEESDIASLATPYDQPMVAPESGVPSSTEPHFERGSASGILRDADHYLPF